METRGPIDSVTHSSGASPEVLVQRARAVAALSERRWSLVGAAGKASEARARQLREHVRSYIVPRAQSLDAPLIVLLLGPTGAGKSTLMNTIAGRPVSRTGVLRPTTREAVLFAADEDASLLTAEGGALAGVPAGRLERASGVGTKPGLAVVDAPDIDSVEHANRVLADTLVEAADLCVFVTTGVRYADRVPWDVLGRVHERGLPLIVVVNRLPPDEADADAVLHDIERLMQEQGLQATSSGGRLQIVGVREGQVDPSRDALQAGSVRPIVEEIDRLSNDREARRQLAAESLAGALRGLGPLVHAVADDLEHEAIDAEALARIAAGIYAEERGALESELRGGRFLREEVLRQWQVFVGADQVTRLFSSGIGRIRGAIVTLIRGTPPAPIATVEEQTTSDLVAVTVSHAAEAARRTAARWAERPEVADAVAGEPGLWSASPDFADRLEERLHGWVSSIATDVQGSGGSKATLARGASLGVNAVGVAVMLSVFSHTGGLTGAEVGVAAATAFLNQKLLNALFGEAATVEMIDRARHRLEEVLVQGFAEERARFDRTVPPATDLRTLAGELRRAADALTT
ncbi:MAG: GTPase [Candidatus Limnocylindrales bacterium]